VPNDLPAILGGEPAFPDGPPPWPIHDESVIAALQAAAVDGSWGRYHGPHTELLKADLATWAGCSQVELCSSGTAASELALRAFKVQAGDEVILAAYDYAASFKNVLMLGATPVLVDADPANFCIRIEQIEATITDATKVIVVSHLHGGVVDMPAVMEIANRKGIAVLEDACQATGATIGGQRLGSFGTLGIVSFGGSKLITAGRGGAILGNDEQLFQRIHLHSFRGNTAYPLSELQAAVLIPQLAKLEQRNRLRDKRVAAIAEAVSTIDGLSMVKQSTSDAMPAWYKVGMHLDPTVFGLERDDFAAAARAEGIACDRSLHGLHTVHSKRRFKAANDLVGSTAINDHALQLHHPILLGAEEEIARLVSAFVRMARDADRIKNR
jgi:dTDP-4-amino-4,6-dideoxygalactose transaminase